MSTKVPKLATIGEVANLLNVPLHRVEYVLRSRPHIQPLAMAAGVRCFDDDAIALVRHELTGIDARRAKRKAGVGSE